MAAHIAHRERSRRARTAEAEPGQNAFRIAVFAVPDNGDALLQVLRRTLDLNPVDTRIHLHALPGLLPERLLEDKADQVAAAIRELGVDAAAVAEADLPDLGHARTVHHVRCGDGGLDVIGAAGEREDTLPWGSLVLVSIADVPLDVTRHNTPPTTTIHSGPGTMPPLHLGVVHGPEMWLVTDNPRRVVRIDHEGMNYEYLGERKTTSATANFRMLVEDLLARAPHAYLTPSARAFVYHGPAEGYRFESQEQHRRAVVLHTLLCRRMREQGASGAAAPPSLRGDQPVPLAQSELDAAHHELHRHIDELREWWHEVDEMGRPRFGEMGTRIEALRNLVADHFTLEERGGYMAAALRQAPRLAEVAERLRSEHAAILDELDRLATALEARTPAFEFWSEARRQLEAVLARLEHHEHAENGLWQSAFDDDFGAGD